MGKSVVAKLEKQIETLQEELEVARENQFLECPNCKKKTKLKNVVMIRRHWYREPYSCAGGDYWEFQEYLVVCYKCNTVTRVYKSGMKKLFQFVDANRMYFGEILNWYPSRYEDFDIDHIRLKEAERKERRL